MAFPTRYSIMKKGIVILAAKIAEIAYKKGIRHIVISPGSRSAPVTLAFARHPGIKTYIIPDERSAGYIALGMSSRLKQAVGIVTTSGTAALNLMPAVAEAYYQHIPILLFTADRPPEWIDQADGQAVHQEGIFGDHIKKTFRFPSDQDFKDINWHAERMVNESINYALEPPQGPVHINIPTREPFYPSAEDVYEFETDPKIIESLKPVYSLDMESWITLRNIWQQCEKILVVGGQNYYNEPLRSNLAYFTRAFQVPIIGDCISNLHCLGKNLVKYHDLILSTHDQKSLPEAPDLLLTFGNSILSKNLKTFLRKSPPKQHWHIQTAGYVPDTFQSLTSTIPLTPEIFFKEAAHHFSGKTKASEYLNTWLEKGTHADKTIRSFFPQKPFSELEAVFTIMKLLPDHVNLHLANSMPVRLVNLFGIDHPHAEVYSNRGTSGIDGCTGSAVGVSIHSDTLNILITGDMAFFYDRNALWHNNVPTNLRIILLNNHSGGIFQLIDGPSGLPELQQYFMADQKLNARNTANDFEMDYAFCNDTETLNKYLKELFLNSRKAKILEIETDSQINKTIFEHFISQFK